jgi:malate dehydrogenase (oxaloacetate-decarboxylating)
MDYFKESLKKHFEWKGKLRVVSNVPLLSKDDLSLAYTPGVAAPCLEIQKDRELSFSLTGRGNLVAVVTDGTAVLGLGDIGPEAAMPVMEGKCALFKEFGGVDAVPICIRSKNVDEIVSAVKLISGSFGGINLEDISAPRCFEIERRLKNECGIPVFHDDQHGTAVVALAALYNALKLAGKALEEITVVISGAGAAGTAVARLLLSVGAGDVILCDRAGAIFEGREGLSPEKAEIAKITNRGRKSGSLSEALKGADVFIGVSVPNCVDGGMVSAMNKKAVVFAMSNPVPEIMPSEAKRGGAFITGTGRSDLPNQINNVLAFPGIFRGALDARAPDITEKMKIAAAKAIAGCVKDADLTPDRILPFALDKGVGTAVAKAVFDCAKREKEETPG